MLTLADLEPEGYETVVVAAPDAQGQLTGRRLPVRHFLANPEAGIDICGYILAHDLARVPQAVPFAGEHTGWADAHLRPDLATLRPYPGAPGTAVCLADVVDAAGEPVPVSPRAVLRHQVVAARRLGYEVLLGPELEFYLFRGHPRDARRRGFRDLEPTFLTRAAGSVVGQAVEEPFFRRLRAELEAAGIPVASCHAEYGYGQWEVTLEHAEALEAADRHLLYKAGVKELALQADMTASFMAKPIADEPGSSCHLHCSLRADGRLAFPEELGSGRLSATGQHFLGGVLARLPELALCFAPSVNSYKRHVPGQVAGGAVCWGLDNRTAAVRVVGAGDSLRLELRYPGADANPYLAAAALIAAGLDGIETARNPGPPVVGDSDARSDLTHTPASLGEALAAFEASAFAATAFGSEVVTHLAALARLEWTAYLQAVTDWEVLRAFELA
jgi:glutamine synthetase